MSSKGMCICFIESLWIMYSQSGLKHIHEGRTKMIVQSIVLLNTENIAFGSANWPLETRVFAK